MCGLGAPCCLTRTLAMKTLLRPQGPGASSLPTIKLVGTSDWGAFKKKSIQGSQAPDEG
jgi:hypothetical protein